MVFCIAFYLKVCGKIVVTKNITKREVLSTAELTSLLTGQAGNSDPAVSSSDKIRAWSLPTFKVGTLVMHYHVHCRILFVSASVARKLLVDTNTGNVISITSGKKTIDALVRFQWLFGTTYLLPGTFDLDINEP